MAPRKRKKKRKAAATVHDTVKMPPPSATTSTKPEVVENKRGSVDVDRRVLPPKAVSKSPPVSKTLSSEEKRVDDLTKKVYAALDQVASQMSGPAAKISEEVQKAAEAAFGLETADALKDKALMLKEQASKAMEAVVKAVDENTPTALKTEAKSFASKAQQAVEKSVGPENIKALQQKASEYTEKASKAMSCGFDQASKAVTADNACEMKDKAIGKVQGAGGELIALLVCCYVSCYMQFENVMSFFLSLWILGQENVSEAGVQISEMLPGMDFEESYQKFTNAFATGDSEKPGAVTAFVQDVVKYIQKMASGDPVEQGDQSDSKCAFNANGDSDS